MKAYPRFEELHLCEDYVLFFKMYIYQIFALIL